MSFMKGDLPKTRKLMKGGIMARSPRAGRCHQVEFEAAEKAELEALKAERWHAIWEGRELTPLKLTKTEDV
ncbi:unnamed protein product [Sphagnum troendelagicum]|uniref:Uncharacterized protein n=1 Tax=Sphagnum troendelagicum TaxID=128251 RepID=A0ABP0V6Z5_9BRYO